MDNMEAIVAGVITLQQTVMKSVVIALLDLISLTKNRHELCLMVLEVN